MNEHVVICPVGFLLGVDAVTNGDFPRCTMFNPVKCLVSNGAKQTTGWRTGKTDKLAGGWKTAALWSWGIPIREPDSECDGVLVRDMVVNL